MINTYNESSLHRTLKVMFAEQYGGRTEEAADGHIYDILDKDGNVIEIQTGNLSKLLPKIRGAAGCGRKFMLVHPLAVTKRILLNDEGGNRISCRKSPVRGCILDLFSELTGIYPVLTDPAFTLKVIEADITEIRTRTPAPVQSANGRRRFKKNWIKEDKKLDSIIRIRTFRGPEDYTALLPPGLPDEFCARDLSAAIAAAEEFPARAASLGSLILWVLSRMGAVAATGTRNRSRTYRISGAAESLPDRGLE